MTTETTLSQDISQAVCWLSFLATVAFFWVNSGPLSFQRSAWEIALLPAAFILSVGLACGLIVVLAIVFFALLDWAGPS